VTGVRTLELSTHLDASPDRVWAHVTRSALLYYVAKGLITFQADDPMGFPEIWREGAYKTRMSLLGVLPIGWQMIRIEYPPVHGDTRTLRDNGFGPLIRTWDHTIEVSPDGQGALYTDRVTIDAGALTPVIVTFARIFYAHRQKRWRRLVSNGFDYAA
jgi:hypothetical protein